MTIKDLNGQLIEKPTYGSKNLLLRICDNCLKEEQIQHRMIYQSRFSRKSEKDFCRECVRKFAATNRRKKDSYETRGYAYRIDKETGKQVMLHIESMEKKLGRKLTETEVVHHIDKNKKNNQIENLCVFENQSQHGKCHQQLENLAVSLYNKGFIGFNHETKDYFIKHEQLASLFEVSYGFESISIKQKKNICNSRLDVDTTSEVIRGVFLKVPMIASNMSTVVDNNFCIKLEKLGALGIMHRADTQSNLIDKIYKLSKETEWTAASIGIEDDQLDFAKALIHSGVDIICIDVAHGYSDRILELGRKIKQYSQDVKIILGNTTNVEMLKEASDFADAIKVGLAQGYACETKNTAGCTEKQFSAVLKFKELSKIYGIPIISDGGIREPADFTKSIAAGANSIMAGKIFAACPESAAPVVEIDGVDKKLYAGMASRFVQNSWKGGLKKGTCPEGGIRYLDIGESLELLIDRYIGALKSGITYAGGKDIKSFQENVEFIRLV